MNYLVEPSFQGVNRLFVLAFLNDKQRTSNKRCCFQNVEIKDYNVMIDGKNSFDQPIRNNKIKYKNIQKLLLVKEMITQIVFYKTIPTLKILTKWL